MTITVTSCEGPHGCFHPASQCHSFREGDHYWSTVAHYCIAQRLAAAEDRERVRMARDADHAAELAATMIEVPDWRERAEATLRHAVLRAFEANLGVRAILVATGDELIESAPPWESLGPILMEVRTLVRQRANDPDAIQCEHQTADSVRFACSHLLASRETVRHYHRRFTGHAADFEMVCAACAVDRAELRKVCGDCFSWLLNGHRDGDLGAPAHRARTTDVRYEHVIVRPSGVEPEGIIAVAAVPKVFGVWLMLDGAGRLHRVDLDRGTAEAGGVVPEGSVDLGAPLDLHVASDGRLAAVAERYGRRAIVLEPASGRVTLSLLRDDYHEERCRFPLGFFELDGRLLLVHAVAWNRLEVSDPISGSLLSKRDALVYSGDARPEHYLDYFHAGLVISPSGERVIDNGWVWHPFGVVRAFSLRRWVDGNPYESEDGPSVKDLCARSYYWDGPVCWLNERTVAVWGAGEDDLELTPAARIFDVETGEELRSFDGPAGDFTFDAPYLVAHDRQTGSTVWDVMTGERVAADASLRPDAYHPHSRCFVTLVHGEGFRVSRRVDA
ncbi:MAG: NADAR family protein [Kofleriaceae bacterium]|nr:NADAR family protein [Kofleriaceae bacterium]